MKQVAKQVKTQKDTEVSRTKSSGTKLFKFDQDLNSWVRIEVRLNEHNAPDEGELVVSDKEQSNLWFAW